MITGIVAVLCLVSLAAGYKFGARSMARRLLFQQPEKIHKVYASVDGEGLNEIAADRLVVRMANGKTFSIDLRDVAGDGTVVLCAGEWPSLSSDPYYHSFLLRSGFASVLMLSVQSDLKVKQP